MTRVLVIDNYDSFVYTLNGYLQQLGAEAGDRPATDQHRIAVALGGHVHVDHQRTRTLRFAW